MKFFVVFLAIIAAVQADGWTRKTSNEIKAIHAKCIAENQVSKENIAKMKHFEYPDKKSVRTFILCCAENMGLFSTQQGYYTDRLIKQFKGDLPVAEVKSMIDGCVGRNEQDSPSDVWAFRGHKCLMTTKIGQNAMKYVNSVNNLLVKII